MSELSQQQIANLRLSDLGILRLAASEEGIHGYALAKLVYGLGNVAGSNVYGKLGTLSKLNQIEEVEDSSDLTADSRRKPYRTTESGMIVVNSSIKLLESWGVIPPAPE